MVAAGFLSHYLSGPLPYVQRHITLNKMCWVRRYIGLYIYLFIYLFISVLNVMKSEHVDFLFNVNFDFIFFVSLLV